MLFKIDKDTAYIVLYSDLPCACSGELNITYFDENHIRAEYWFGDLEGKKDFYHQQILKKEYEPMVFESAAMAYAAYAGISTWNVKFEDDTSWNKFSLEDVHYEYNLA